MTRPSPFQGPYAALSLLERHEAWALLAWASGRPRPFWMARTPGEWQDEADRQPGLIALLNQLVARRAAGVPLAHLTGEREFYSLPFWVTPDVLIPRQETEELVDLTLQQLDRMPPLQRPLRLLEWGVGSGCLLISLFKALQDRSLEVEAWGLEQSTAAATVARANALRHLPKAVKAGRLQIGHGNWSSKAQPGRLPPGWKADILVSNPPYLAAQDPHLLSIDLQREPAEALVGIRPSRDGLDDMRQIVAGLDRWLEPGGHLLVEHGADQQEQVMEIFRQAGLESVVGHSDLYGRNRFVVGLLRSTA